jgi:hypothetical protein
MQGEVLLCWPLCEVGAQSGQHGCQTHRVKFDPASWGSGPRKNSGIHIDVSHSRQPLVKGERLVRYEVNTVIGCNGHGSQLRADAFFRGAR